MAARGSKRKVNEYEVCPLKRSKKDAKVRYFSGQLSHEKGCVRLISFEPSLRDHLYSGVSRKKSGGLLKINGGCVDDAACIACRFVGGSGGILPQENFGILVVSKLILVGFRTYLRICINGGVLLNICVLYSYYCH